MGKKRESKGKVVSSCRYICRLGNALNPASIREKKKADDSVEYVCNFGINDCSALQAYRNSAYHKQ